ncbi:MAG: hypothetical protein AAFY08_09820 [Planctomycetota bacterium]
MNQAVLKPQMNADERRYRWFGVYQRGAAWSLFIGIGCFAGVAFGLFAWFVPLQGGLAKDSILGLIAVPLFCGLLGALLGFVLAHYTFRLAAYLRSSAFICGSQNEQPTTPS